MRISTRGFVKVDQVYVKATRTTETFFKPVRLNDVSPGLWLLCAEDDMPFHWGFDTLDAAQAIVDAWNRECDRREDEVMP